MSHIYFSNSVLNEPLSLGETNDFDYVYILCVVLCLVCEWTLLHSFKVEAVFSNVFLEDTESTKK